MNIIAEIGCNHKGDINIAKRMITAATDVNVRIIKFQKRNNKELLTDKEYNLPHPEPVHSYGDTYGEHRENLEFSIEQHNELKKYCEERGVVYTCSVWDLTSAKQICSLKPEFIKIPSAINLNFEVLNYLCDNFEGDIHISFGMTTHLEQNEIINFTEKKRRNKSIIIYACTSGYPIGFQEACLLEISRLKKKYSHLVKAVGYSGHHLGISLDCAAAALGAEWLERHITLNKNWKGTDHAASLEIREMGELVNNLNNIHDAMDYKMPDILPVEQKQREKLKKIKI